jgi:hypothetical protein
MHRYPTRLQAKKAAAAPVVPAPAPAPPAGRWSVNTTTVLQLLDEIPGLSLLERIQKITALFKILASDPKLTTVMNNHRGRGVVLNRIQHFRVERDALQADFTALSKVYFSLRDLNRCVAAQTELHTEIERMRRLLHEFALLELEMADVEKLCT